MTLASRVGVGLLFAIIGSAGPVYAGVPGQFIAKMYSEALGRAPDSGGWSSASEYFSQNGCSTNTLATWGKSVFASSEFADDGNNNAAIVLILYRAILNREPDSGGFSTYYNDLNNGTLSLASAVSTFFGSSEFAGDVSQICSLGSYSFELGGQAVAIPIPPGTPYVSEQTLQTELCEAGQAATSAKPGIVSLAPQSVVVLTSTLQIPPLVTLTTSGQPSPHQHAMMARLVRTSDSTTAPITFDGPMVEIEASTVAIANSPAVPACAGLSQQYTPTPGVSGGSLRNVWVDGGRYFVSSSNTSIPNQGFVYGAIDVQINGGTGVVVDSNFLSNSRGWTTLHSFGNLDLYPQTCGSNTITNNTITAYPALHIEGGGTTSAGEEAHGPTDGLSIGCENSTVENNGIVDATDAPIVVFTAGDAECTAFSSTSACTTTATVAQKSTVSSNTIVSAGNSAFTALTFDPLTYRSTGSGSPYPMTNTFPSFAGASIASNTFWASPSTHFIIGLEVGTMATFMNSTPSSNPGNGPGVVGTGASATSNTTAGITTTMGIGIAVSGMENATVQSNTFTRASINSSTSGSTTCPQANIDVTSGILAMVTPSGTTRDTASGANAQGPSEDSSMLVSGTPCMGPSL
jgi:hypothetical protein